MCNIWKKHVDNYQILLYNKRIDKRIYNKEEIE